MKKLIFVLTLTLAVSCAAPVQSTEPIAVPSPEQTVTAEASAPVPEGPILTYLLIREGDQIERDLLPRLTATFQQSTEAIKSAMAAVGGADLISPALTDFRRMEGMFVPGTYPIEPDMTLEAFLEEQISLSKQRLERYATQVLRNKRTPAEALILASVIEAECLDNRFYQETADVFNNRLDAGMPMQSCVTTEYALGLQRFFLYAKDTQVQSPYNTYQVAGLPLGPIASFDDASLQAALTKQADLSLLYFYYDYLTDKMHFFSDYRQFKKEANASMQRFVTTDPRDPRDPINKQDIYR